MLTGCIALSPKRRSQSRELSEEPRRVAGLFLCKHIPHAARCRILAQPAYCFLVWRRPPTESPTPCNACPWRLKAVRDVEIRTIAQGRSGLSAPGVRPDAIGEPRDEPGSEGASPADGPDVHRLGRSSGDQALNRATTRAFHVQPFRASHAVQQWRCYLVRRPVVSPCSAVEGGVRKASNRSLTMA
jgi:hypothetical protein